VVARENEYQATKMGEPYAVASADSDPEPKEVVIAAYYRRDDGSSVQLEGIGWTSQQYEYANKIVQEVRIWCASDEAPGTLELVVQKEIRSVSRAHRRKLPAKFPFVSP
jgi:hypothetical protein